MTIPFTLPDDVVGLQIEVINDDTATSLLMVHCLIPPDNDRIACPVFFSLLYLLLCYLLFVRYDGPEHRKSRCVIVVIAVTACYMSLPLANTYLIDGHDLEFHLARIEGIYMALRDGQIPMWINAWQCWKYGYPTAIFYPQLFCYIPALLHLAGVSLLVSVKMFLCLTNLAAVSIAYFSFKNLFGQRKPALVSALSYSISLYYFSDLYTRGAIGELQALVFAPLLMTAAYEVFCRDEKKWPLAVLALTGVIGSHMLSVVIDLLAVGVTFLCLLPRMIHDHFFSRLRAMIKIAAVTALVNLYYIVPFLSYYREDLVVLQESTDAKLKSVIDNGIYLSQMFKGYDSVGEISEPLGVAQEMGLGVGVFSLFALVGLAVILWYGRRIWKKTVQGAEIQAMGLYAVIGSAITLYVSSWLFPWDLVAKVPLLNKLLNIQFSWRFLGLTTLFAALGEGCLLLFLCELIERRELVHFSRHSDEKSKERQEIAGSAGKRLVGVLLCAVTIGLIWLNSFYYLQSTTGTASCTGKGEVAAAYFMDNLYTYRDSRGFETAPKIPQSSVENTRFDDYIRVQTTTEFQYHLPSGKNEAVLTVPVIDYPGYAAYLNGQKTEIIPDENHVVTVHVTGNTGSVRVVFEAPLKWKMAYVVSAGTAALLLLSLLVQALLKGERRNKRGQSRLSGNSVASSRN